MPSLKDMRTQAKEAGLMKLDRLIATRQRIPNCDIPIPIKELCERYEKLYTGCINDVMRELCLLDQTSLLYSSSIPSSCLRSFFASRYEPPSTF